MRGRNKEEEEGEKENRQLVTEETEINEVRRRRRRERQYLNGKGNPGSEEGPGDDGGGTAKNN